MTSSLPSPPFFLLLTVLRWHRSFRCFFTQGARTTVVKRYLVMAAAMRFTVFSGRAFRRPRLVASPAQTCGSLLPTTEGRE